MDYAVMQKRPSAPEPVTAYHEKKIGNTRYRITSVYMGEFDLGRALEELAVKKILALENTPRRFSG